MDLDELLDSPAQGPKRPTRFAPKGAKLRPKTEPSQSLPPSSSSSVPTREDIGGDVKPEHANDDAIDMDVDMKPVVKNEEGDDLMETEATEVEFEDDVVREFDVYFNPSIDPQTQLYLFQYPLRPVWRPYELEDRCEEVRVKPETAEVEIDLAVDVDSQNYDSSADARVQMKKQTLIPSWKPPHTSGCAVGIVSGNKLHLNPIHAVVQLRSSMHHLDSKDSERKTVVRSDAKDNPSGTSNTNMLVWNSLKYHSVRSDMATGYLQKMMAREGSQIYFSMSSYDYLKSLCPGSCSGSLSSKGPPRRFLLDLPLEERLRTRLLEDPQVHRFDALKYLAPDKSLEELLGALHEQARLVQGLWTAKSSLVYGTDQGVKVFARDYVLLLFSKSVIINKSQVPGQRQLAEAMTNVLNVLATERPALKDWKLKQPPDLSFIKLYPFIVKKQQEEWECLEQKISSFPGGRNGPTMKTSSKSITINKQATSRGSNMTPTGTSSGSTPTTGLSEEVRDVIRKALQKLLRSIKVCSIQQISQQLRNMAASESASSGFAKEAVAAADSIDAFPDELQAIISQVAVNIHGICIPKSSPVHEFNEFRKVVIDLFIAEGPNAKLKKDPIHKAAEIKLHRKIPQAEYKKVMEELCIYKSSAWVLRSGNPN